LERRKAEAEGSCWCPWCRPWLQAFLRPRRRAATQANVDFLGGEEPVHGGGQVFLTDPLLLRFWQLGNEGRAKFATGFPGDGVAPLPDDLAEPVQEDFIHLGLAGELVEVGDSGFGQEQAVLVAQHDGLAAGAILVLFELELAQIVVGLLAVGCLDPLRYCRKRKAPCQAVEPEMPEPEAMPCKLGWLSTVTEPFATIAKACMCMAKA
jgi:hypothetical protein